MKLNLRRHIHFGGMFGYYLLIIFFLWFLVSTAVRFLVEPYQGRNDFLDTIMSFILLVVIICIIFGYFLQQFFLKRSLKKRQQRLFDSCLSRNMTPHEIPLPDSLAAISEGKRDIDQINGFSAVDWGFSDFKFSIYRKTKHGEYKAETHYYAVAAFRLPRKLPNVFFDSKRSGGREFRRLFKSSQRHSLEGDFDKFFSTYFHEDYTIDNLSFITPEVMEAIKVAKNYDVEIFNNMLYLYNELEDMPFQLNDIEQKGKYVRQKLIDNTDNYRDERIHKDVGRKTVSLLGLRLRRSLTSFYLSAAGAGLLAIAGVVVIVGELASRNAFTTTGPYMIIIGVMVMLKNLGNIKRIKDQEAYAEKMKHVGA